MNDFGGPGVLLHSELFRFIEEFYLSVWGEFGRNLGASVNLK